MEKGNKSREVSRVEDDYNMLHIRAISLDILSELLCDLAVPLEKVFPCHALLTRRSTRRNNIFSVFVGLLHISRVSDVCPLECTVEHFLCNSFKTFCKRVVKAEVRSKLHHHSGLCHI